MIAYLSGQVLLQKNSLIILVAGVGYEVKASTVLLSKLKNNQELSLFIYTHVREDKLELYGFETETEKELFLMLLSVSGVGPASALSIVALGTAQITEAVQNAKVSIFSSVQRVGKKLAQKIIIELKGKLGELKALDLGPKSEKYSSSLEALTNLGFDENKVAEALETLSLDEMTEAEIIRETMKLIK